MIFRIYTDATWVSHEPGLEGERTYSQMKELYRSTVDKEAYPTFEGWLWDMERSATFFRHVRRTA
ncbi:MAG: hypothetical protein IJ087_01310 [Eggerthellaceae bacterium]|nr:hypothetical protein [Eggerthellaceae bacterium]